jgi:hypothetical protein
MHEKISQFWLAKTVQFFRNTVPESEIQCKKIKYMSAISENNKKPKHHEWQNFLIKLFILKWSIC